MNLPLLSLGLIKTITEYNKKINRNTYATNGFEGTCYNRCTGSSYRPFSSNLQQLVTPKNAVKNEQDTSLPWSNSPATAPKCWVKLSLINLPLINCQPRYVDFELLHYMCGQSSFNAHADSNLVYSQTRNKM